MKPVLDCVAPTQPLLPFDSIALGRRAFLVIRPDEWPTEALCWSSPREKGLVRRAWRKAVAAEFGTHARVLRLAWVLAELCSRSGFAFASDGWLARETGLRLEAVQRALSKLGEGGAILRAHVPNGRSFQRRIFLAAAIVRRHRMTQFTVTGGRHTSRRPISYPSLSTGQKVDKYPRRNAFRQRPTVQEAALAEAERRAAREHGDSSFKHLR